MSNPWLKRFLEAIERLGLSDIQIAAASGLSPVTVRLARAGMPPKRPRAKAAFEAFIEAAELAKTRADLRLS